MYQVTIKDGKAVVKPVKREIDQIKRRSLLAKTVFLVKTSVNGAKDCYAYFTLAEAEDYKEYALEMIAELYDPYGEESYAFIEQTTVQEHFDRLKSVVGKEEAIRLMQHRFESRYDRIREVIEED